MTPDAELIGLVEEYLDEFEGLTPLPGQLRDRVRTELPHTKQARPLVGLARFSEMSNPFKIGVAAAVLGAATLIGFFYYQQGNLPGQESPSPSPTIAAEAAVPAELQHPFLGPKREIPGVEVVDQTVIRFDDHSMSVGFGDNRSGFYSFVYQAGPGRIQLVSVTSVVCNPDAVGMYSYQFTRGGNFMTLTADSDECPSRRAALEGTWETSACRNPDNWCLGVLTAGTYSSAFVEPRPKGEWHPRYGALTFEVPDGWANYSDGPDEYGLAPAASYTSGSECYPCDGPNDVLTVLVAPSAAKSDCSTPDASIGGSIDDLAGWLTHHPGLVASAQASTVNGYRAIEVDLSVAANWRGTCDQQDPFVAVPAFVHENGFQWALSKGDRWHVWLIDLGNQATVAVVAYANPTRLDAYVADARSIVESLEFPDR